MTKAEIIQKLKELDEHLNYSSDEYARFWNETHPHFEPITWHEIRIAKLAEAERVINEIINDK